MPLRGTEAKSISTLSTGVKLCDLETHGEGPDNLGLGVDVYGVEGLLRR